jgi:hypothetical protein
MKSTDPSFPRLIMILVFLVGALYFWFVKAKDALNQVWLDPRLYNAFYLYVAIGAVFAIIGAVLAIRKRKNV